MPFRTSSGSPRVDFQSNGVVAAVCGAALLAAFPVLRVVPVGAPGSVLTFLATLAGACTLVWGLSAAWTGEPKPLTPRRALWIPVLTTLPFVAGMLLTEPPSPSVYDPVDATVSGALGVIFDSNVEPFVVAGTFGVLGSALRRRDWRWTVGGLLLSGVGALGIRMDFAEGPARVSVAGVALAVAIGVPVLYFAFETTEPGEN